MALNIGAEVLRVRDVFGNTADVRVPPYQRGFAWRDEHVGDLVSDFLAAFDQGAPYFLGAIVVVQTRPRGPSDVVDGQQRLTVLTIIIAALRDLSTSSDEQATLHSMIGHEVMTLGQRQRWRLTVNHLDNDFFRERVQARGATLKLDETPLSGLSDSQRRLMRAIRLVRDELLEMSAEDRSRFAVWLSHELSLARVRVGDYDLGYRVFRVLNRRGLPLTDHDILKSSLFERAGFSDAEAIDYATRWSEHSYRLGSEPFEGMLRQIRAIYDRSIRGEFIEGLLHSILVRMPVRTFLNDILPRYVDAYEAVMYARYDRVDPGPEGRRALAFLRAIDHEGWRAPALRFLVEHPAQKEAAGRFLVGLERLAYMMQYTVKDREYRPKRYRRLLEAMEREFDVDAFAPLELTTEERAAFLERLAGKFSNSKQRRALALRLNAELPGGDVVPVEADATLEHILPRIPRPGSRWLTVWTRAAERDDLVECIGNFTLLTDAENQEADREEFDRKLAIYFRNGAPSFAMSLDLAGRTDWTPDDVRARRDAMVEVLRRVWAL